MHPRRPYYYDHARNLLALIMSDMEVLAGDSVGPSGATWQDVAGTCAVNLRLLARQLEAARAGEVKDGPVVFPSPNEEY